MTFHFLVYSQMPLTAKPGQVKLMNQEFHWVARTQLLGMSSVASQEHEQEAGPEAEAGLYSRNTDRWYRHTKAQLNPRHHKTTPNKILLDLPLSMR